MDIGCCYSVSRSQRAPISSAWLSISYLHVGYAVCVPAKTMAHGYAVNWGDSLTLYRHCYACADDPRETAMQGTDQELTMSQFSLRNPAGKQKAITAGYYARLRNRAISLTYSKSIFRGENVLGRSTVQ